MTTMNVRFTENCNGSCPFCVDSMQKKVKDSDIFKLIDTVKKSECDEVLILGGEPTIKHGLSLFVNEIAFNPRRKVIITSNGFRTNTPEYFELLKNISAINFSVHHYDLKLNEELTGIDISVDGLKKSIGILKKNGAKVRLNTLLIRGFIDSAEKSSKMTEFAKSIGADVRFSEMISPDYLKEKVRNYCLERFVSAREVFNDSRLDDLRKNGCELRVGDVLVKAFCGSGCPKVTNPCDQPEIKPDKDGDSCRKVSNPCGSCKHFTQGLVVSNDGKVHEGWHALAEATS
jgi:molybdenum cofactor biosynthesis enzyme MoaA